MEDEDLYSLSLSSTARSIRLATACSSLSEGALVILLEPRKGTNHQQTCIMPWDAIHNFKKGAILC